MRASARPLSRPEPMGVPRSRTSGGARQVAGGQLRLCALPSAPFWARQYTRLFLANCPGVCDDATETAQLIVSELVTNAARASASTLGIIGLSLRPVKNKLIIEVRDQSADPPVLAPANRDAEHGRGLVLVDALSEEWGYSAEPRGGKVVYAIVRLTLPQSRSSAARGCLRVPRLPAALGPAPKVTLASPATPSPSQDRWSISAEDPVPPRAHDLPR